MVVMGRLGRAAWNGVEALTAKNHAASKARWGASVFNAGKEILGERSVLVLRHDNNVTR